MIKQSKHALTFIFITMLIDVIGLGIIVPVVPKLIEELIAGNISDASRYGGWLTFAYAIMQFIFSPVLGNLSDRFGRRPILLLALLGLGANYVLIAMAPTIAWLFVGRMISGIAGGSFTTASAYIVDISTPEKRTQNLGLIGAAFGMGFIIGPVLGGILGEYGSRLPFWVAAALSIANMMYGYFVLPESLPVEKRRSFDWKRANPLGAMKNLKKYAAIGGLIAAIFSMNMGAHAIQSVWTYFSIERFEWSESLIGYSLGFVGLMVAIVQGLLIRYINPRLGNVKSIYIGIGLYTGGLILFSFASATWMMFAFTIPYAIGGIATPALQSMVSGRALPEEQGELQGILTSLVSVTAILSPPLMTNVFAYFTQDGAPFYFPGAAFLLGAFFLVISLFLVYPVLKKEKSI